MSRESTAAGLEWDATRNGWRVTSQRLARIVFSDPHVSVVQDPALATSWVRPADEVPSVAEFFGSWFSRSPRHREVRGELRPSYAPSAMAALEDVFREVAEAQLQRLPASGDLMDAYFTPYGTWTTARMMDVPENEWPTVHKVITIVTAFMKKPLSQTAFSISSAELRAVETCILYLRRLVDRLFEAETPGPVVAALKRIAQQEGASVWLAVTATGQLLTAGVEPMTTGAGLACRQMFADPDLLAAVRDGSVGAQDVAEEALRLNPPFPYIHRWIQEPCDCLGVHIEPGEYLVIDVRAVNRDPRVLDAPDEFRSRRSRHLNQTFGRGAHQCLGIHSARLQIAVALKALLAHQPRVRVDPAAAEIVDVGYLLAVKSLPFNVEAA